MKSRVYGIAQSVLFVLFALVVWFDTAPRTIGGGPFLPVVGDLLCLLGVALLLVALQTIGKSIQIAPAPRADAELVTRGIYGRLRHPIYTGIALVVAGFVVRGITPIGALLALAIVVFLVFKARYEETLLTARYPQYAEYRRRTRGVLY